MNLDFYQSSFFKSFLEQVGQFLQAHRAKKLALYGSVEALLEINRCLNLAEFRLSLITNKPIYDVPRALFPREVDFETPSPGREAPVIKTKDYEAVLLVDFFHQESMRQHALNAGYDEAAIINLFQKAEGFVTCNRYGFSWELDLSNATEYGIYTGHYEDEDIFLWKSLLRPGDVAVDVGANMGLFSLVAARQVHEHGRVLAIEPVPRMARRLEHTLEVNQIHQVTVLPCFAGKESGRQRECREYDRFLWLRRSMKQKRTLSWQVDVKKLDDLIKEQEIESLRAIKIDVDGSSYFDVLHGARQTIETFQPFLLLEFIDLPSYRLANEEWIGYFVDLGYQFYHRHRLAYPIPAQEILKTLSHGYNLFLQPPQLPKKPILESLEPLTCKMTQETIDHKEP